MELLIVAILLLVVIYFATKVKKDKQKPEDITLEVKTTVT